MPECLRCLKDPGRTEGSRHKSDSGPSPTVQGPRLKARGDTDGCPVPGLLNEARGQNPRLKKKKKMKPYPREMISGEGWQRESTIALKTRGGGPSAPPPPEYQGSAGHSNVISLDSEKCFC